MTAQSAVKHTLNPGQKAAADAFFKFLFTEARELDIRGPGGVGKSFLVTQLIDVIMPQYEHTCQLMGIEPLYDEVSITATTNKAAEILAQGTGRPTSTIHSFLGLKVRNDFKTGETKLTRKTGWKKKARTIVFIDECSMIDSPLYYEIHAALEEHCKIVYVGDHCQLAPVMERISPVYKGGHISHVELTENVRAAGQPALLAINEQLRETVKTGVFNPIAEVPGVIDYYDDDQVQTVIQQLFSTQTRDHRILCFTNERVRMFNEHIRDLRQLPDHYTAGEWLVNNQALILGGCTLSVEAEVEVTKVASFTDTIMVTPNESMDVRLMSLRLPNGVELENVAVPEDRDRYHHLVNYFAKTKVWDAHFGLKEGYPDLRQGDASTVYKAQGSTYDTVIVDLEDIGTCINPDQVARMLYVALSRARNHVILWGQLPEKYGGPAN